MVKWKKGRWCPAAAAEWRNGGMLGGKSTMVRSVVHHRLEVKRKGMRRGGRKWGRSVADEAREIQCTYADEGNLEVGRYAQGKLSCCQDLEDLEGNLKISSKRCQRSGQPIWVSCTFLQLHSPQSTTRANQCRQKPKTVCQLPGHLSLIISTIRTLRLQMRTELLDGLIPSETLIS